MIFSAADASSSALSAMPSARPFLQQSDTAGADERIIVFNLLRGRPGKIFGIGFPGSVLFRL